ncbi:YpdA family putative bacillithiol disulfide reductase [Adhaeribacter sp. BT258]|uniref:YpdA family putative bacillithiol disulfide reductase n=1 Tax=Adhaeribacter terrigena TaxID=2793070 RepID=A0ABS1C1E0_9BACT|nr:YpdA family putative bacillithiol disulfide reductase [Adhaeribacter terrigena]MBK0403187.1 YpdA family putative bacillithiol disulfide reductase [Adhaeribacter terrigena]
MKEILDILIIGAGPIGLACGLEAKKAGLSYLIVDKGCLVNSLYNYPLNMTFFSTADRLEIGGIPFTSITAKPGRAEALEYYRRVADSQNLNLALFEEVKTVGETAEKVYRVETSKATYFAKHVIIAIGFYDVPNLLNVPGEELPKVRHYYFDPHYYFRQKVLVVGANNSSADVALETWRKGAEVTMVIRESELGRIKYWTKPDLENRIKEGCIRAYFNSHITGIREKEVDIQTPAGKVTIQNDYVMAMTGYQPDFSFLEKIGIQLSEDGRKHPVYNTETQETNLPNVFLAGVICGGLDTHIWFIENSRVHAEQIVKHILAKAEKA